MAQGNAACQLRFGLSSIGNVLLGLDSAHGTVFFCLPCSAASGVHGAVQDWHRKEIDE
jgi:hypothetical protein